MEQIQRLALDKITTKKQVREYFDQESIAGLAETLKSQGQLQPIRVRKVGDKYETVDGERRYREASMHWRHVADVRAARCSCRCRLACPGMCGVVSRSASPVR